MPLTSPAPPPKVFRPSSLVASSKSVSPSRHVYDVIVLGGQLAGTVAGGILSKHGFRVLQVNNYGLDTSYEHQGYQFPYAPAIFPHFRRIPAVESTFAELGISVEVNRALESSGGEIQFLLPNHRLDFPSEKETNRRASELEREFPLHKDRIIGFLASQSAWVETTHALFGSHVSLSPSNFLEKLAIKKFISTNSSSFQPMNGWSELDDLPLGQAIRGLYPFLGYLHEPQVGSVGCQRVMALALQGVYRFPEGIDGLRNIVARRLQDLGGELQGHNSERTVVEELLFEGGHFSGIKLASSPHAFRAKCLIAGTDLESLAALVSPKIKRTGFANLFQAIQPRRSLLATNLVVKAAGLPLGLKELAMIISDLLPEPVLLEIVPARKAGEKIPDERILSVASFVHSSEHQASEERLATLVAKLEAVILDLAPFLTPYIVTRSTPYLDAKFLKTGKFLYHPLLEIDSPRYLGISGLPHRTPCKNLFLASREVLPGLGVEGEILAGARTATLVQESLKKYNPLR